MQAAAAALHATNVCISSKTERLGQQQHTQHNLHPPVARVSQASPEKADHLLLMVFYGLKCWCPASPYCCLQVISNAGLRNTYGNLLPPDVLANNPEMQEQLQQAAAAGGSPTTVNLYLGLNEPLVPEFDSLGTVRVFDSADHDTAEAMLRSDVRSESPPVEICCVDGREVIMPGAAAASSKGSGLPRGLGVSTVQVITFASYDHF